MKLREVNLSLRTQSTISDKKYRFFQATAIFMSYSAEGRSIRGVIKDQLEQRMDERTQRHKIKRREVAEGMAYA